MAVRLRLNVGDRVDRWQIKGKLGEGAFGEVYEVTDTRGKLKGLKALKLEDTAAPDQVLRIEVAVLEAHARAGLGQHTGTVEATGICHTYERSMNYLAMTIFGETINALRKKAVNKQFSQQTCMIVFYQAVQAIKNMHTVGWLHRDIKPSNFAIRHPSHPDNKRVIYILDFGLSRYYTTTSGGVRRARRRVGFRGTLRYCSLNGHKGMELGRQDDLLSAIHMLLELMHGGLPWTMLSNPRAVQISKENETRRLLEPLPASFASLYDYMYTLAYEDTPPYDRFDAAIGEVIDVDKVLELVPDWEKEQPATASQYLQRFANIINPFSRNRTSMTPTAEATDAHVTYDVTQTTTVNEHNNDTT